MSLFPRFGIYPVFFAVLICGTLLGKSQELFYLALVIALITGIYVSYYLRRVEIIYSVEGFLEAVKTAKENGVTIHIKGATCPHCGKSVLSEKEEQE